MKKHLVNLIGLIACCALFSACSSNAKYVETGGSESLVSTNKINMADWDKAAAGLIQDMLESGTFDQFKLPVKMQVTRITLTGVTSNDIKTNILQNKITTALNSSGKVAVVSKDQMSQEVAQYNAMMSGKGVSLPKLIMNGDITEDRERVGSTREVTYIFSINLENNGVQIWKGERRISKQSSSSALGL